jgi:hypothetical protein
MRTFNEMPETPKMIAEKKRKDRENKLKRIMGENNDE